jgi:hypothetical protein
VKTKRTNVRATAPAKPPAPPWQLRLYVTGETEKSRRAFSNLKEICECDHETNNHNSESLFDRN